MLKPTQNSLDKLEEMLKELEYKVRFEKGNFKSGACILLDHKIIMVNKFSTIENKISALVEIIAQLAFDESLLSEKSRTLYRNLQQTKIEFEE